jgi:pimeloyl-ACP methyl ester carboxylesterase
MKKNIYKKLSILVNLLVIFSLFASVFAQTRGRTSSTSNKKQTSTTLIEKKEDFCDIWSGVIEIKKHRSENKTKVTVPGEHISDNEYTGTLVTKSLYDYKAIFDIVRSSGNTYEDGTKTITLKGAVSGEVYNEDDEKDSWKTKTGKNVTSNITERGELARTKSDAMMFIKGKQFTIRLAVPEISGKRVQKSTEKPFGWCMMEMNPPSESLDESAVSFSSENIEIEGDLDAKNPNLLKGTLQPDAETTITWNLARRQVECDEPLQINDLRLAHQVFPNKTEWVEIDDKTVDGNEIRITANVVNGSNKAKSATVTFKETKSGEVLGEVPVSVSAESEKQVEFLWETDGYAWTDDRRNGSQREIEASIAGDSETTKVVIIPKPVILVHGLWSNAAAWSEYHNYLEEAHSFAWKAYAVGADPAHGVMNTGDHFGNNAPTNSIFENARELGKQIKFAQEDLNAWHVDIVAHSMGGLISRFYIHNYMKDSPDGKPVVTRLIMLGTPNMGSPWADIMFEKFKNNGYHVEALRELKTDVCKVFNSQVTNRKNVKFSIIYTDKIPFTGNTNEPGDGVVSVSSAIWEIADKSLSDSLEHTKLTGKSDFMRFVYPRLAAKPKKAK